MKYLSVFTTLAAILIVTVPAPGGVQTTTCANLGGGVWRYTFFSCVENIDANDLHINLLVSEIVQGEQVVGCGAPSLPGYSCSFTPNGATYVFPTIGPFDCVPSIPGDINKFVIEILTSDGVTLVEEIWTFDGVVVGAYVSVIACPPVSVEPESWGRIKTLYR